MDQTASKRGFDGHLISQACGAINDNFFRMTFAFVAAMGVSNQLGAQRAALLGGIFMIPMVLLQPLGGFFADRLPMHSYIRFLRCSECLLVLLGIAALSLMNFPLMLLAIFLLGAQSALYGPAKYAIIPQLVSDHDLEQANGQIQAFTTIAIITGTMLTALVDPQNIEHSVFNGFSMTEMMALIAMLVAVLGICSAFRITQLKPQNPNITLASMWNLREHLRLLHAGYRLWPLMLTLAGFWFIGALLMSLMPGISISYGLSQSHFALLSFWIMLGIACGSLGAAALHARSYPGAVPCIGALLTSVGLFYAAVAASQARMADDTLSIFTMLQHSSVGAFAGALFISGFGFGLIVVPVNTLLQQRSSNADRGRLFAIVGILGSLGTLLGFLTVYISGFFLLSPMILMYTALLCGGAAVVCTIVYRYQIAALPLILLSRFCYNVEVRGADNIPLQGGCLIVCNHVSYVDGLIIGPNLPRHGKYMVYEYFVKMPVIGFFLRALGVIPIAGDGGRRALVASIDAAVAAAQAGEVVVIFPEGKLTRSGHIDTFQRGMERIARRAGVPVIPAHLDGLYGSIASRAPHKQLPLPRRTVALRIGAAMDATVTSAQARQHVMSLAYETAQAHVDQMQDTLGSSLLKQCKRHPLRTAVIEDSGSLSYLKLAATAKALVAHFDWQPDEQQVGILLPPGRAGALVNAAAALDGRCAVNINHTVGAENVRYMCESSELKSVITSKLYWRHLKMEELPVTMIYIEDCLKALSTIAVMGWMSSIMLLPSATLCRGQAEDCAVILYSSGSTGRPKGVQLSHRNLLYNAHAVCAHMNIDDRTDRILNPLPYFHSFGLSVGLWLCLSNGLATISQIDPRDGTAIGKLCQEHHASILISTPTFVRSYMRRIDKTQLAQLRFAMVGSEKCPLDLRQQFREKYEAELLEGYGCTELSPVVSANVPDILRDGITETGTRDHSIGRPLPGLEVFTVNPETNEPLPQGESGLLVVRSPSRMMGYLKQDELTQEVFIHGGYNTGDIGHIDKDGFIYITGRLARFAKVGGEMVPLDNIQEKLQQFASDINAECLVAVAAVSDPQRGERLVVMHTGVNCEPDEMLKALDDLPPVFKPKSRDIHVVESLPVLGSGKLDLKGIKQLAEEIA